MTIYTISKELCEIRLSRELSGENKEQLFNEAMSGDLEPIELDRFTDLEKAKAAFKELTAELTAYRQDESVKTSRYAGINLAIFQLYTIEEWNVDEDGDIIDGGDVWEWEIV